MTISRKVIVFVAAALSVLFVSACDIQDLYFTLPDDEQTAPDDSTLGDGGGHHG